jgi:hypothetical protein
MVQELPQFLDRPLSLNADDAQTCGEPPKVAPAPSKHTRSHGRLHWEEGEEVVEDIVGEGADAVARSHRRRSPVLFPWRHFAEQSSGVGLGSKKCQMTEKWREWGRKA